MNESLKRKFVIITDLDGSLLHSRTYSYEEAKPALERIAHDKIPLILCSSKTRAELEVYRTRLENRHPFIVENGGGIFVPDGYFPYTVKGDRRGNYRVVSLGAAYDDIRKHFVSLRERLKIEVRGFGDMTISEVMALTGLNRFEASLAMMREYEEPFVFANTPDERFFQAIEAEGLRWTQGRIFHIMGNHHKGKAVSILKKFYQRAHGAVTLMGLGDSLNDLPFLLAVDRPVLIRRDDGSYDSRVTIPNLYCTDGIGPAGWNEAVLRELS
jgi:mannosyl-3-phosphoglycerate phosphatase family protein